MSVALNEDSLGRVLDAIYDAAVDPDGWPPALNCLAELFHSHFADIFARRWDWSEFHGIAIGLDRADYEDQFLGQWTNRNVWTQASPAQDAGEVKPTWQMVSKQDVLRSAIYNEYLRERDLNEGMRLVLWSGDGWLQDISLLRPWRAGPFDGFELDLARRLLPHLQRASATSRGLRGLDAMAAFDTLERPAFLLDARGKVLRHNASCESLLAEAGGLAIRDKVLEAANVEDNGQLAAAIARAGCIGRTLPQATMLSVGGQDAAAKLALTVVPVRDRADRTIPAPRSVLVLASPPARRPVSTQDLIAGFGLTQAEAALATGLLSGHALSDVAAAKGRSINTLRAQLARIMVKTNTRRQSELVLLLSQVG